MKLIRSKTFWASIIVLSAYWFVAPFTEFYPRIEVLNAMLFGVGMAVLIAYGGRALKTVYIDDVGYYDLLVFGIAIGALSRGIEAFWRLIWRALDEPMWMQREDLVGWFLWLSIVSSVLLLLSPRTVEGDVPPPFLILLGSGIGIGLTIACMVLFVST